MPNSTESTRKSPRGWSHVELGKLNKAFHAGGVKAACEAVPERERIEVLKKLDAMELREISPEERAHIKAFLDFVGRSSYPDLVARDVIAALRDVIAKYEAKL